MVLNTSTRNRMRKGATYGYVQQSDLIVQCARKCIEENGVQKTTLSSIAREANITRELIYYYFSGKQEILSFVVDSYVADVVDTALLWADTWRGEDSEKDTPLPREALVDIVTSVRRVFFESSGQRRPLLRALDEIGARQKGITNMCDEIVRNLQNDSITQRLAVTFPQFMGEKMNLVVRFSLIGLIGVMETSSLESDEAIASVVFKRLDAPL